MPNAERDAVCAGHRVERGTGNAPAIYHALPTSMTNKVLVQLDCATHAMVVARNRLLLLMWEGCSNTRRCIPASGIPYGGPPDRPWAGAHATIKASLVEWITNGTFDRR